MHPASHADIAEVTAGGGGSKKNLSGYRGGRRYFGVLLHMELVLVISKTRLEIY